MVRFILTRGLEYTLDGLRDSIPPSMFGAMTYDRLICSRRLPAATTIFADLDRLGYADRELAGRLYRELREKGQRVLNDPAKFKNRDILLRDLHGAGLNDFRAFRADQLVPDLQFPAFVRKLQGHGRPSTLLPDWAGLRAFLDGQNEKGVPLEHLLVIEYAGEPHVTGVFRKVGMFRVGDDFVPSLCGWDESWTVKDGNDRLHTTAFFQEELKLIQDNPFREHFRRAFDLAGIDYGRADFSFLRGRIQIFEINTLPAFFHYTSFPSPIRFTSIRARAEKLRAAFAKIDTPSGPAVWLSKRSIPRHHRGWRGLLNRTRQVD